MEFNGTTNGDTVGFHMKKEGYNDYTCIYIHIYTTYMGCSWEYFSGCKPGENTSKGWDSAPSNYHEIDTYPLATGSARPIAGLMD